MSRNYQSNYQSKIVEPCCNFCKNAGKTFDHWLKNRDGSISCPVLNTIECQNCFKKGHTQTQCPLRKQDLPMRVSAPQIIRTVVASSFASKNAFASLDSDSDEDTGKKNTNNNPIVSVAGARSVAVAVAGPGPGARPGSRPGAGARPVAATQDNYPNLPTRKPSSQIDVTSNTKAYIDVIKESMETVDEYELNGNKIYDYFEEKFPLLGSFAGKVVGMIMELPLEEVKELIAFKIKLNERIFEAMDALGHPIAQVKATAPAPQVKVTAQVLKPTVGVKRSWSDDNDSEDEATDNSAW